MDPNQDRRVQAAFDGYVDKATAWDQCQKVRADERRKVWLEAASMAREVAQQWQNGADGKVSSEGTSLRVLADQFSALAEQ